MRKIFSLILSVIFVMGALSVSADNAITLPEPIDIPKGLSVVENIGGDGLPNIGGRSSTLAPQISAISEITSPDDTLVISGDKLKGASLVIWAEGDLREVTPTYSDDVKMYAVIPKDMRYTTMLVWPVKDGVYGSPIRVNAPKIWWTSCDFLFAEKEYQEIRFFGRNFMLGDDNPYVFVKYEGGEVERLEIINCNPYQVTVKAPSNLKKGRQIEIFVHNGTGGIYGWSNSITAKVVGSDLVDYNELPVIDVGAPDTGDNAPKINAALGVANANGGGIIRFEEGEYLVNSAIIVNGVYPKGLYIEGMGIGDYDGASKLEAADLEHRGFSGIFTTVRFLDHMNIPSSLFQISSPNVTLQKFNLISGDTGEGGRTARSVVKAYASDTLIENVRVIKINLRDYYLSKLTTCQATQAIHIYSGGQDKQIERISIKNSEFHFLSVGIGISDADSSRSFMPVKNIEISNVKFIGYSPDKISISAASHVGPAYNAISTVGSNRFIVEKCFFKSYNKSAGKLIDRMFCAISGEASNTYIADNEARDLGPHLACTGIDGNTGEQILFHGGSNGGLFDVVNSMKATTTVGAYTVKIINEQGVEEEKDRSEVSTLFSETAVERNTFTAFIASGKGAGQVRKLKNYTKNNDGTYTLQLEENWRVQPDGTSKILIAFMFMNNTVYKNNIENELYLEKNLKTGGVLIYLHCHEFIVANNHFKNLPWGVSVNASYRTPVTWIYVINNKMEGMWEKELNGGSGGDSVTNSCFMGVLFKNHNYSVATGYMPLNNEYLWNTFGNIFRRNECIGGDSVGEIITQRWAYNNTPNLDIMNNIGGLVMTVMENNTFRDVKQGIMIGNPSESMLLRNNTIEFIDKNKALQEGYKPIPVVFKHNPTKHNLIYMENNKMIDIVAKKEMEPITIKVNGVKVSFSDQEPIIVDDRIFAPVRNVATAMGSTVIWDGEKQTVIFSRGSKVVYLTVGLQTAKINGEEVLLDVPLQISGNRIMVPVRFLGELFGYTIQWDSENRIVTFSIPSKAQ